MEKQSVFYKFELDYSIALATTNTAQKTKLVKWIISVKILT